MGNNSLPIQTNWREDDQDLLCLFLIALDLPEAKFSIKRSPKS